VTLGEAVFDTATVAGAGPGFAEPTGGVDFLLCQGADIPDAQCNLIATNAQFTDGKARAGGVSPGFAGTWCFRATYSGDGNYEGAADRSLGECVNVARHATSLTTTPSAASIVVGGTAHDTAALSGGLDDGFPLPSGDASFTLCGPLDAAAPCADGTPVGNADATTSADVSPTEPGTYCFAATYAGDDNYLPSSDDSAGECFVVLQLPDTHLDKTASVDGGADGQDVDAVPGDTVAYTVTVTNEGGVHATNVTVTEAVPPHSTFVAGSCSPACSGPDASGTLTWVLADVAPGDVDALSFRVTLDATFDAGTTAVTNTAHASSDQEPCCKDSPTVTVRVTATPDLAMAKTADVGEASPGQTVTFTLTYYNRGDGNVAGATITDTLDPAFALVSCDGCAVSGPTLTWTKDVPAGTSLTAPAGRVTVAVTVAATQACSVTNRATISSPLQAATTALEASAASVQVIPDINLANADGTALALALNGAPPLAALPGPAASVQHGPGEATPGHDDLVDMPVASLAYVSALNETTTSSVDAAKRVATQVSDTEVLDLNIADMIKAHAVRARVTAVATETGATYDYAGSTIQDLWVSGIGPIDNITPGARIDLPAMVFGAGSYVAVFETTGMVTPGTGGTYASDASATMIHVVITDLIGADTSLDLSVAAASAHADFPKRNVCPAGAAQDVSGHAEVAHVTTSLVAPGLLVGPVSVGRVDLDPTGVGAHQELANVEVDTSGLLSAHASASDTRGFRTSTGSQGNSSSEVADVCLLDGGSACLVSATAVRADASADATAAGATAHGATRIVGLKVSSTTIHLDACTLVPAPVPETTIDNACTPAANTLVQFQDPIPNVPGLSIILNEQVTESGVGHAGITVRAIHIHYEPAPGTFVDVIVGEAHADATYAPA
jgi:uncharacterized repeat protein (TIGR01451 family)